jgi:hypothetical protein
MYIMFTVYNHSGAQRGLYGRFETLAMRAEETSRSSEYDSASRSAYPGFGSAAIVSHIFHDYFSSFNAETSKNYLIVCPNIYVNSAFIITPVQVNPDLRH